MEQQRNAKCNCGSNLKYKKCCMLKGFQQTSGNASRASTAQLERSMQRELLPFMMLAVSVISLRR